MQEIIEQGLHEDGSFRFNIPIELKKGSDGKTWIEGIASVESPDLVGETVIQKGMDIGYFLKKGFFNDNHDKTTSGKIGIPTEAKITPQGFFVKGYLLDTDRARSVVELADALQKSGGERRLGFSVEGKVREKDGKLIKKCWVKDVAITAEPIHPETYLNIVKSLSARIEEEGYIDEAGSVIFARDGKEEVYWAKLGEVVGKSISEALVDLKKALPVDAEKSMEAGHEQPPASGGAALRRESLEGDLTNLDLPQDRIEKKKKLTKKEAEGLLVKKGYGQEAAAKIAKMLMDPEVQRFLESAA